jgi:hypothetical protein
MFLVLMTSDFTPFSKFGELTALGLVTALLFDLFVTPALLMVVFGRKKPKPAVAAAAPAG